MKKPTQKQTIIGVVVAGALALVVAMIANAGPVCAEVQNPIGRAVCNMVVTTAQQHLSAESDGGTP